MNVVTGGLGFIGNELVRQLLAAGEPVVVLDNKNRVAPDIGDLKHVELVEIDITNKEAVEKFFAHSRPASVFHMAAIHYIPECNADPSRTLRVNVEGTQNVLESASRAGVTKIVFASSGAVYADSAGLLHESTAIAPVDIYGWSKLFGEQLCQLNHSLHGTNIIMARLFNNYGPRETNPHIIPEITRQLRTSDQLNLGNISTVRDYIHTRDCAQALIRLKNAATNGIEAVNVATGTGFTVRNVIDLIAEVTGKVIQVNYDNTRVRRFDKQTQVADITKLRELTGWQPEISFGDGIKDLMVFEGLIKNG